MSIARVHTVKHARQLYARDGDSECSDCVDIKDRWLADLIEEATEAIDGVEVP